MKLKIFLIIGVILAISTFALAQSLIKIDNNQEIINNNVKCIDIKINSIQFYSMMQKDFCNCIKESKKLVENTKNSLKYSLPEYDELLSMNSCDWYLVEQEREHD